MRRRNGRPALGMAIPMLLACLLAIRASAGSTVQKTWTSPVSGNWTDGNKWSPSGEPDNDAATGTSYDVLFNAAGAPYTVTYNDTVSVNSVVLNSPDVTLDDTGDLTTPTLNLTAGKFILDYALTGATISGGGSLVIGNSPLMRGVTFASDFNNLAPFTIYNDLTLQGATLGLAGGQTGVFAFIGSQQIAGTGSIVFNSSSSAPKPDLEPYNPTDTLTIAAGITIRTGSSGGGIGHVPNGMMINHGTLSAQARDWDWWSPAKAWLAMETWRRRTAAS